MAQKESVVSIILEILTESARLLPLPFEAPYAHLKRIRRISPGGYTHAVWQMRKRGVVEVVNEKNQRFLKITKKGQLQILLEKAKVKRQAKWDGKWRLLVFDIPEDFRDKRNHLRRLLRLNNFYKLQASVFINPYSLNREAIAYLKETGLIEFIRIMRVDEMDDDKKLRKLFHLN